MSAECKKLRGPNDTGPDCGCRGDACALGRDAATERAIFAVDGGNATGSAWGIFDLESSSVKEAFETMRGHGSRTFNHRVRRKGKMVVENPMTDEEQIAQLREEISNFIYEANCDTDVIVEDFILLPGAHSGGKDGVASVRIGWGLRGYLLATDPEIDVIWQPPSVMGRVKDEHLRQYGVWIPGRDHERAAWRHIAARLNKLLK